MYLKSLTLKGFKSFASSTTLRLEPGITAVVGPNGSGKSNVVDAMAWVLGEQGAKALRGGKMDDVIFAGTADRPPLGRAEVTLTIDNSDGALPINGDEITITRRMFRDGAGEYEINGKACRLLDIQELLSDSGIGREMHIIVSQGHLDAVLSARPEDRRAFIEEAAGVLKHRKRKEKALRKLDAMAANLARLSDLTAELRRQLGPLGRQAATARRAAGIQADLRDARLRLLADDIATLQQQVDADAEAEEAVRRHRAALQLRLAEVAASGEAATAALAAATPAVRRAQDTHFALAALVERFRGVQALATERARNLAAPVPGIGSGRDPDEMDRDADLADQEQADARSAAEKAREDLAIAVDQRAALETELAAAEAALASRLRSEADRREELATLAGRVGSARTRLTAGQDEVERLAAAIAEATERAEAARGSFEELRGSIGDLDTDQGGLDEQHEAAAAAAEKAAQQVASLQVEAQDLRSRQAELKARIEALALGLERGDGPGAVMAAQPPGMLGLVSDLVEVTSGAETAIAAALGGAADAVAVTDLAAAIGVLEALGRDDAGRAGILVGGRAVDLPPGPPPADAQWARDCVSAPDPVQGALYGLLGDVVIVDDLAAAQRIVAGNPDLKAVTRGGDLVGAHWVFGGSRGRQSPIEIQAAVDEARTQLREAERAAEQVAQRLGEAQRRAEEAAVAAERTLSALYESDAAMSAIAEQLAQLGAAARSAEAEAARLETRRESATAAQQGAQQLVADLAERLEAAEQQQPDETPDRIPRDELAQNLSEARHTEMEARLALRSAEERARAAAEAASRLRKAAAGEREAIARAEREAASRAAGAAMARRVADLAKLGIEQLDRSLTAAAAARAAVERDRDEAERAAAVAREELAAVQAEWDTLTDSVHSNEVARAGQQVRLEQLVATATAEFGVGVDDLIADYGPDQPVPPSAQEMSEYQTAKDRGDPVSAPIPMPYDRPSTERRAARAAKDMAALGKINPLALEEFAAMEERHGFLSAQLDDLRGTRTDLLAVIDEVDEKILELFTAAYHDVAAEFRTVFATLFPGGEGELQLTDPDDMVTTGIEVSARPPGKKVKRLSLLSGGERSLVAVAMLVAIFRARPSPFYVLDEVEAALDEVNLARLVGLLRELRTSSQLIVITHQKYTMEAADVLYGVSMRGDGISQVISQRMTTAPGAGGEEDHGLSESLVGAGSATETSRQVGTGG